MAFMNKRTSPAQKHVARAVASVKTVTASSIRWNPEVKAGLEAMRQVVNVPVNKLVNQAVAEFVDRQARILESELESVLANLRKYRKADPKFKAAIRRTAAAESKYAAVDPAEGVAFDTREAVGPTTRKVKKLLGT